MNKYVFIFIFINERQTVGMKGILNSNKSGLSARMVGVLTHPPLTRLYNHVRVGMSGMPHPHTVCRSYTKINMSYT